MAEDPCFPEFSSLAAGMNSEQKELTFFHMKAIALICTFVALNLTFYIPQW